MMIMKKTQNILELYKKLFLFLLNNDVIYIFSLKIILLKFYNIYLYKLNNPNILISLNICYLCFELFKCIETQNLKVIHK